MTATAVPATPVLALESITKTFGDLTALHEVSLDLLSGQVHALLGANGSGKSTLVKIMSGVYQPDGGTLTTDGTRLASFGSPAGAARHGIRVVHQEAPLIDTASVAEAVAIFRGFGTAQLGRIGWRRLRREVQELLDRMDVPVRASAQCSSVGPADRAGLALAIVAGDLFESERQGPPPVRLLIVDEVTAAIHESESGRHLERLRAIADRGVAVVMVTHRLSELRIADDISILRGGRLVYREAGQSRRSVGELVAAMVGTADRSAVETADRSATSAPAGPAAELDGSDPVAARLDQLWRIAPRHTAPSAPSTDTGGDVVAVTGLAGGALSGCSFTARPGEIVGFAGLRGSGVEELPRMLSGDLRWTSGSVRVGDHLERRGGSPQRMIDAGLTAIAADRLRAGGVASLTVAENVTLPDLKPYWHRSRLRSRVVSSVIDAFDVRPPDPSALFGGLSGGNQQKALLGKWLLLRPSVLVLGDPTYGVDPGARETIFAAVQDAARRGVCVLFFSTEPEQLVRICGRALVLRDGQIVTELNGSDLTLENLVEWSEQ